MTVFDYTSRDYASIQSDLLLRAESVLPSWTSRDASDFGVLMVDLWAYMGDMLHYYVDRAAGESRIETATQRDSILSIASLLDYIPTGRYPSRGTISLDITNSVGTDASPVVIPKYTRFVATPKVDNASQVVFTLNNAIAINSSGTAYVDPVTYETYTTYAKSVGVISGIAVTEGERFEEYYNSSGLSSQQVVLANTGIVPESVEVYVAEGSGGAYILYSQVDRLITATSTQRSYFTLPTADDRLIVNFGNGVNGTIPMTNAQIKVLYRRSRGDAGNLPPYSITGFESTILSNGASLSGITVVGNTSSTAGGSNSESMASMKANIPLSFRTQDRAVSLQDYKDLALRVVGTIKATSILNSGTVNVIVVGPQGDYSSRSLAQNSISADTALEDAVEVYLSERSIVGVAYTVSSSVTLQSVKVTVAVNVLDGYIQENVATNVNTAITDLFTFDKVSFGGTVSLGELYRTILAVKGVDYATVSRFTTGSGSTTIDGTTHKGVTANTTSLLYIATDALPVIATTGGIVGS